MAMPHTQFCGVWYYNKMQTEIACHCALLQQSSKPQNVGFALSVKSSLPLCTHMMDIIIECMGL